MMFAQRDALERRYDGPIPPADPAASTALPAQRARLFQRMAQEARNQVAVRRKRLPAKMVVIDPRLRRLGADLRLYRTLGLVWRSP